ncbi:Crp/Fnr family transcriptional regulator [Aeromonas enteropelogenes]|uniref:Crp/Fnr family transcriptional regulator n=1 Tax=Aeromonas enteropelogenes TaxID=29489 RepID=UPI003B9E5186
MHYQEEHHQIVDIEWPCALSAQARRQLLEIAMPCRDGLLREPSPGIFYVASGCLVNYMTLSATNNSFGLILGRGSWFGIQSIHSSRRVHEVYEPVQHVELLFFPKAGIESLLKREPELYVFLFHIAEKMSRFGFQLVCNSLRNLKGRVIYALLHLAECHAGSRSGEYVLHVTQHALGHIVGATRPRVSEVLKTLVEAGAIRIERGKITLLRPDFLQAKLIPSDHQYYLPKIT